MLPKIDKPLYTLTIPSTEQEVRYRPFLVKEEKILLMAAEGKEQSEIMKAVKQIINNCVVEPGFDVNELATFDIEYFFVHLRAKSVGNIVQIRINDEELEIPIMVDLDLEKVTVEGQRKAPLIKISDTMSIQLRYPRADFMEKIDIGDSYTKNIFEIIVYLLDKLYDGDNVYKFSEYSKKEIEEFVENLPVQIITEVDQFLRNMPTVYCEVPYMANGVEKKAVLSSLSDFFTLG